MAIDNINNEVKANSLYKSPTKLKAEKQTEFLKSQGVITEPKAEDFKKNEDVFIKNPVSDSITSSIYDKTTVSGLVADTNQRIEQFEKLLTSMLTKQGEKSNLTLFGKNLTVTPEQSAKAKAAISDGGEYSVDAVSTRIMNMAKALAGGDGSKLEKLREAVEKGFKAAAGELGNKKTPDVTTRTYEEVMRRFDDWKESFKGSSATKPPASNSTGEATKSE